MVMLVEPGDPTRKNGQHLEVCLITKQQQTPQTTTSARRAAPGIPSKEAPVDMFTRVPPSGGQTATVLRGFQ